MDIIKVYLICYYIFIFYKIYIKYIDKKVEGATGYYNSNLINKATAAVENIKD